MLVSDAQREVRTVYLGGFVGQLVSAMVWLASAAIATLVKPKVGFWALAIGGAAIFPLTQTLLRLAGRRAALTRENPLGHLAMQIAFTVPIVFPLAGAAALYRLGWFYPACMIIVGAHYLPFVFLYGMKTYAVLAVALICAGFAIGLYGPDQVVLGGGSGARSCLFSRLPCSALLTKGWQLELRRRRDYRFEPRTGVHGLNAPEPWTLTLRFQILAPPNANNVSIARPPRHTPTTRPRSGVGRMTCVGPSSAHT